ncbi:P protein-like [Anastrepha ludens]|uniref:P protein-like n=1 Tax=Anastrepha ludens TaxID=28586 RepID=UPI0023B03B5C|nr:P protein-like [Anastrepha ludens]
MAQDFTPQISGASLSTSQSRVELGKHGGLTREGLNELLDEELELSKAQRKLLRHYGMKINQKRKKKKQNELDLQINDIIEVKREWAKPIGLFLVWFLCTLQFLIYRDLPNSQKLIAILPNETLELIVPDIADVTNTISLSIKGPFLSDGDLRYAKRESEARFVYLQAMRTFYDEEGTPIITVQIANVWREYIDLSKPIEMISPDERYVLLNVWKNISKDENTQVRLRLYTDLDVIVTLKYNYDWFPVPASQGLLYAVLVLALLYVLYIFEITNPTIASLICSTFALAILSALIPIPSFDMIMLWIDMPMLCLLFSLMLIVSVISDSGVFDFAAVYAYQISRGQIWRLIFYLCICISVMSAFLNNSTTMLLATPIIIKLCEVSGYNPVYVLTYLLICANIGAAFTPLGSPPNIIITTNQYLMRKGIVFSNFVIHLAPCTFLVLLQTHWQLRYYFRHTDLIGYKESSIIRAERIKRGIERWSRASSNVGNVLHDDKKVRNIMLRVVETFRDEYIEDEQPQAQPKPPVVDSKFNFEEALKMLKAHHTSIDKVLLIKSAIVLVFIIIIYLLGTYDYFNMVSYSWTAVLGALLLLILAEVNDFEALLCRIEWSTLMFLSSFFVLIEVLSKMGFEHLLEGIVTKAITNTAERYQLLVALMLVLWITALSSSFLNNNPVTQMMVRIVISLGQNPNLTLPLQPLVWALVLGAAFGGNGTIIGASANIVTAGVANRHLYKLTFRSYFLIGFSTMLGNVLVASLYLILMHVVFKWGNK